MTFEFKDHRSWGSSVDEGEGHGANTILKIKDLDLILETLWCLLGSQQSFRPYPDPSPGSPRSRERTLALGETLPLGDLHTPRDLGLTEDEVAHHALH